MRLEYKVWNIHKDWQPLKATNLEDAAREVAAGDPYNEEAVLRDAETGQTWSRRRPETKINFGPE